MHRDAETCAAFGACFRPECEPETRAAIAARNGALDHRLRATDECAQPHAREVSVLRRDLAVTAPNQVWCSERTDVPMPHGHAFLCAVMEGNSGKVPGGAVRNTRDVSRCLAALALARKSGEVPEIFNPDQGRQFSAQEGTGKLRDRGSKTRMDGKGRGIDSVFLERLWRSVKHDGIYLREYAPIAELKKGLEKWFTNDNPWRPHAALGGATPAAVPAQNPAATEPPEEQQKAA